MSPVVDRAPHRKRRRVSRAVVAAVVFGTSDPAGRRLARPRPTRSATCASRRRAWPPTSMTLENRADDLSEDYAEAVYELQAARPAGGPGQVPDGRCRLRRSARPATASSDYAVNAYVQFDQTSDLMVFLGSTPENTEARIGYADMAVGKDRALADTLRSASEDAAFARVRSQSQRERQNHAAGAGDGRQEGRRASGDGPAAGALEGAGPAGDVGQAGAGAPCRGGRQGGSSSPAAEPVGPRGLLDGRGATCRRRRPVCPVRSPPRAASSACAYRWASFHAGRGLRLLRPHVVGVGASGQGAPALVTGAVRVASRMCPSTSCSRATSCSSAAGA